MVGVANAIVGSFVICGVALHGRNVGLNGGAERRGRNAGGLKHPPLLGALDGSRIERACRYCGGG